MVIENVDGTELRFKNPGRLLIILAAFAFLGVGFLDLLGHKSAEPDVLGLYSLPFFIFILLYGVVLILWWVLFFNSNLQSLILRGVRYIQSRTWLALVTLSGLFLGLWIIFEWDRWSRLPVLQFAAFGLITLAILILLFTDWDNSHGQTWRKAIVYPFAALLVLEVILQITSWTVGLPGLREVGGNYYPYERVYYNSGETLQNGFANRYGWYSPDSKLDDSSKRVLIVGGGHVQDHHVLPEEQFPMLLSEQIKQDQIDSSQQTEIVPIGMPGFGVSPFLYEDAMNELPGILKVDEIVILFHLGDDFQSPVSSHNAIQYLANETGETKIDPNDARLRHDLTHYYMRGFMSFQLVGTMRSNYLTPKVLAALVQGNVQQTKASSLSTGDADPDFPRQVGSVADVYVLTEPGHSGIKSTNLETISGGNNFMFLQGGDEERREAIAIADNLLKTAQQIASTKNITLRIVTVPTFPEEFYDAYQTGQWEPQLDGYDLFLPEKALMEIADKYGIPILPMGHYMYEDGLTVDEIKSLYMPGNETSFTAKGHSYFADALYSAFYTGQK